MTEPNKLPAAEFNAAYRRLLALQEHFETQGQNRHVQAHALIYACIGEGIDNGSQIVGVLGKLGFDKQHAGMTLQKGLQRQPEWPNWGLGPDGKYYAPPEPPAAQ
jgi:hypothetical protein